MKIPAALLCLAVAASASASGPAAAPRWTAFLGPNPVSQDPPRDPQHPARNQQLLIDSHGAKMNALFFLAPGAYPHPTLLLLHGLPGNERNLDLAQAARREGWNVLTFTYRGAWGSEGDFSIANALEDTHAALAFLRLPETIRAYDIDPARIIIGGHSMGGFAAAYEAASEDRAAPAPAAHPPLAGLLLLDAWNIAAAANRARAGGAAGRAALVAGMDDFGRALHGATPDSIADEVIARGAGWDLAALAPRLTHLPIFTVFATHGEATENMATFHALMDAQALVLWHEFDTDHAFSDHRIEMEIEVVRWLQGYDGFGGGRLSAPRDPGSAGQ